MQAWSPLGRRRIMDDELIRALAEKHQVTQAQICLRYALQKGVVPIPKASSEERMKNNQGIFRFELTKTEMQKLDTMPPVGWSGEHPDRERVSIESHQNKRKKGEEKDENHFERWICKRVRQEYVCA